MCPSINDIDDTLSPDFEEVVANKEIDWLVAGIITGLIIIGVIVLITITNTTPPPVTP